MSMRKVEDDATNGARQEWGTPTKIFAALDEEFKFTVDACATAHNAKLTRFWSPEDDGLAQVWEGERVFCNPPYNAIEPWLARGWLAISRDPSTVCAYLIPPRTDASWFHTFARLGRRDYFRGRISFVIPPEVRDAFEARAKESDALADEAEALALVSDEAKTLVEQARAEARKLRAQAKGSGNAEGSMFLIFADDINIGTADFGCSRDSATGKIFEPLLPTLASVPPVVALARECRFCNKSGGAFVQSTIAGRIHEKCHETLLADLRALAPEDRAAFEASLRA